jgi:hypothetical protein
MKQIRIRVLALPAAVMLAAVGAAGAQQSSSPAVSNDQRLFQRFIEDGAVVENIWMEAQVRYQSFKDSDVTSLSPLFAMSFAEDFEVGARVPFMNVDPDDGGSETGIGDTDIWGKIRLTTKPTQLSVGVLFKLPTGDEEKSLRIGTGETDIAFFGGVRHDFDAVSLVGNATLRINQDPEVADPELLRELNLGGRSAEGETSLGVGGGLLFSMTSRLSGVIEASYETERINGMGSDLRITLGGDYRFGEIAGFRIGAAGGSGDSAADYEVIGGIYLFL